MLAPAFAGLSDYFFNEHKPVAIDNKKISSTTSLALPVRDYFMIFAILK
jgi:hypothetical protein